MFHTLPMVSAPGLEDVRAMHYFDSLSDEEAALFAKELVAKSYSAREFVMVEGEPSKGFYLVRKGKARILRTAADGREQTYRLVAPGETFGEVPIFDGEASPATVEAIEPLDVVLVPSDSFIRLIKAHPGVSMALLRHFARRLRSFTELIEQISLQTVQSRIARYLYQLAREEGARQDNGIVVPREITQQDLASLVGSVREVVSRTLKVMEEDGIVEVRRRDILIRDLDALYRML